MRSTNSLAMFFLTAALFLGCTHDPYAAPLQAHPATAATDDSESGQLLPGAGTQASPGSATEDLVDSANETTTTDGCPYAQLTTQEAQQGAGGKLIEQLIAQPEYQYQLNGSTAYRSLFMFEPDLRQWTESHPDVKAKWTDQVSLKQLFDGSSGTYEGYTIGEHTARVLTLFEGQKAHWGLEHLPAKEGVTDWTQLMRMTLAFHDIGKAVAVDFGDKHMEERFSVPLARGLLRTAGFSPVEVEIAAQLIQNHQLIGRVLMGDKNIDDAKRALRIAAQKTGLAPATFLLLEHIVYNADAGSYPSLCSSVFSTDSDGFMHIREEKKLEGILHKVAASK